MSDVRERIEDELDKFAHHVSTRAQQNLIGYGKALVAAADAILAIVGEWQPIETAPKDGAVIDLYGTRNGVPQRFPDAKWDQVVINGNPIDEWRWLHPGWAIYGRFEYTHWRPLPEPPK